MIHCGLKFPYKTIEGKLPNPGYLRILNHCPHGSQERAGYSHFGLRAFETMGHSVSLHPYRRWPGQTIFDRTGSQQQYLRGCPILPVRFTRKRLDGFFLNADVFVLPCRICENGDRGRYSGFPHGSHGLPAPGCIIRYFRDT